MKKTLAILLFTFIAAISFAQTDSIRGKQFQLKGKIINHIQLTPHCGVVAWGTVIEFQIISFSDTSYKNDSIGVIFTCPEFYKNNFFEIGATYTLKVADENQANFGWAIPNESLLSKYNLKKKLWVMKADKQQ